MSGPSQTWLKEEGRRSFKEIVEDTKQNRKILEIRLTRLPVDYEGIPELAKFEKDDCEGVVLHTAVYVPLNVADEEVLRICDAYGTVKNNQVIRESPSKATRGVKGSTRYVDMELNPGEQLRNYYWL